MLVKRNQPFVSDALERWFAIPTLPAAAGQTDRVQPVTQGHGRLEMRPLACRTGLDTYLGGPGGASRPPRR
jgi:hypothetical protein